MGNVNFFSPFFLPLEIQLLLKLLFKINPVDFNCITHDVSMSYFVTEM